MPAKGFTHESTASTVSVEHFTPPALLEAIGLDFDLDPCHPEVELPWTIAKRVYTKADDGLVQPWSGLVFLNPPYGKQVPLWLEKMHEHRRGVALLFARPDTAWFHDYVAKADAVLFLRGRLRFVQAPLRGPNNKDVDGSTMKAGDAAPAPSMLVAWGAEAKYALVRMAREGMGSLWNLSRPIAFASPVNPVEEAA